MNKIVYLFLATIILSALLGEAKKVQQQEEQEQQKEQGEGQEQGEDEQEEEEQQTSKNQHKEQKIAPKPTIASPPVKTNTPVKANSLPITSSNDDATPSTDGTDIQLQTTKKVTLHLSSHSFQHKLPFSLMKQTTLKIVVTQIALASSGVVAALLLNEVELQKQNVLNGNQISFKPVGVTGKYHLTIRTVKINIGRAKVRVTLNTTQIGTYSIILYPPDAHDLIYLPMTVSQLKRFEMAVSVDKSDVQLTLTAYSRKLMKPVISLLASGKQNKEYQDLLPDVYDVILRRIKGCDADCDIIISFTEGMQWCYPGYYMEYAVCSAIQPIHVISSLAPILTSSSSSNTSGLHAYDDGIKTIAYQNIIVASNTVFKIDLNANCNIRIIDMMGSQNVQAIIQGPDMKQYTRLHFAGPELKNIPNVTIAGNYKFYFKTLELIPAIANITITIGKSAYDISVVFTNNPQSSLSFPLNLLTPKMLPSKLGFTIQPNIDSLSRIRALIYDSNGNQVTQGLLNQPTQTITALVDPGQYILTLIEDCDGPCSISIEIPSSISICSPGYTYVTLSSDCRKTSFLANNAKFIAIGLGGVLLVMIGALFGCSWYQNKTIMSTLSSICCCCCGSSDPSDSGPSNFTAIPVPGPSAVSAHQMSDGPTGSCLSADRPSKIQNTIVHQ